MQQQRSNIVFQYINVCQVPREVLKTSLGTWQTLMHEKQCLIPIDNVREVKSNAVLSKLADVALCIMTWFGDVNLPIQRVNDSVPDLIQDITLEKGPHKIRHHQKYHLAIARLVDCFGFNGPLRQYFSLYRAVSQREGERKEKR